MFARYHRSFKLQQENINQRFFLAGTVSFIYNYLMLEGTTSEYLVIRVLLDLGTSIPIVAPSGPISPQRS